MKKLIVLVSILFLTGIAQAAEWTQALTADLSARNLGRSRVTDTSVVIKIWQGDALTNAGVGVSGNSVLKLYTNTITEAAITINVGNAALDTVGEVVDYINTNFSTDSAVEFYASIGPDGYRDMPSHSLLAANISAPGQTKALASDVTTANSRLLSAGVEAVDGVTPRIKSISAQIPLNPGVGNYITLSVYDGNTRVWRRTTSATANQTSNADSSSPNSVTFPEAKGISATKGSGLVAVATTDANVDTDTIADAINSISIIYDNYRD